MRRWTANRPPLDGAQFEVVVMGGGINGVAIARECARAGRSTLLLEQHDFGSGTTSRSTRIIHGGLRYLEHGEIGLVRESLRERQRLLHGHPHVVRPVEFLVALADHGAHSALEVRFALWLYRRFAHHSVCNSDASEIARLERQLDSGRRWSIFSYEDAQCEFPERLIAEWLTDSIAARAVARNYTEVLEIEIARGRAKGVIARDLKTGQEARIAARKIINATGPWADRVCCESRIQTARPMVGGVRGSHIVLPQFAGAPQAAIYAEAVDGRPIFIIPWNSQLLVGTTEIPDNSEPAAAQASEAEIEYLFDSFVKLFPSAQIAWEDVRYSFAGVRPLPYAPDRKPAAVSRRHIIHDHASDGVAGMISIIGGKLTTAASLARACARKIGIRAPEPLSFSLADLTRDSIEAVIQKRARTLAEFSGVPEGQARALVEWHGPSADLIARLARRNAALRQTLCPHTSHIAAEAIIAVEREGAVTLADILLRRVPVALGPCWSEDCARAAARVIGSTLGWSESETGRQLESFDIERRQFLRVPQRVSVRPRYSLSDPRKRAA